MQRTEFKNYHITADNNQGIVILGNSPSISKSYLFAGRTTTPIFICYTIVAYAVSALQQVKKCRRLSTHNTYSSATSTKSVVSFRWRFRTGKVLSITETHFFTFLWISTRLLDISRNCLTVSGTATVSNW